MSERVKELSVGDKLSVMVEEAVGVWHKRELTRQHLGRKHTGRLYPQREKNIIRLQNSHGRGEFIGERLDGVLGKGEEFARVFGNQINSRLQGKDSGQLLKELKEELQSLTSNQIDLAFEFFEIRREFKTNPSGARKKFDEFIGKNTDSIPEEGFLPGFFRTISNLYPTS